MGEILFITRGLFDGIEKIGRNLANVEAQAFPICPCVPMDKHLSAVGVEISTHCSLQTRV